MLSQFSVKNFKSIRDNVTLVMQAVNINEYKDSLIPSPYKAKENFLPVSVIYGPNGGGKSNVLNALIYLCTKVRELDGVLGPDGKEYKLPDSAVPDFPPFLFNEDSVKSPTELELYFITDKGEYRYTVNIYRRNVTYESLYIKKNTTGRSSLLFERDGAKLYINTELPKIHSVKEISSNLLLLTYMDKMYGNNDYIADVMEWFRIGILVMPASELYTLGVNPSLEIDRVHQLTMNMIKEMDIDIVDYRIEKENNTLRFLTKHIVNGMEKELNLSEESLGTRKLFNIVPVIAFALFKGSALVIDELDSSIHPILLKYIVNLFTNKSVNKKGAQLIYTSHDLSTMNPDVFRRDEIWFVAKGSSENSELYSLVDFKDNKGKSIRNDARYDKQYLEGKYGADPYLRKIIDWER